MRARYQAKLSVLNMCKSLNQFSDFVTPVTLLKNSGVTKCTPKKVNCHIAFLKFVTLLHLLHRKNNTNLKTSLNCYISKNVFRYITHAIFITNSINIYIFNFLGVRVRYFSCLEGGAVFLVLQVLQVLQTKKSQLPYSFFDGAFCNTVKFYGCYRCYKTAPQHVA